MCEIYSKLTIKTPDRHQLTNKLLCNFFETKFPYECSPVILLHISRTPFFPRTPLRECFFFLCCAQSRGIFQTLSNIFKRYTSLYWIYSDRIITHDFRDRKKVRGLKMNDDHRSDNRKTYNIFITMSEAAIGGVL